MIVVSSSGDEFERVAEREGAQTFAVEMATEISPWCDFVSLRRLWRLIRQGERICWRPMFRESKLRTHPTICSYLWHGLFRGGDHAWPTNNLTWQLGLSCLQFAVGCGFLKTVCSSMVRGPSNQMPKLFCRASLALDELFGSNFRAIFL